MGQISINLTDNDKLTLKKEAKKQKKSLSEFCRERILNPHKQIPSEKSTDFIHSADIDKKLTTLNKNLIVLFNEIKVLQQNQLEMRKQVYYNSSYLYFLTHELFADNPEIAHKIDEKIKQVLPDFPKFAITYSVTENEEGSRVNQQKMQKSLKDYDEMFGTNSDLSRIQTYNENLNQRLARKIKISQRSWIMQRVFQCRVC